MAKEAAKPDSTQAVVGQQELSPTKTKADKPAPQVPVRQTVPLAPNGSDALDWGSAGFVSVPPPPDVYSLPPVPPGPPPPEASLRVGTFGGYGGLDRGPIEGLGSAGLLVGFAVGPWSFDARGWYQRPGLEAALDRSFSGFDGLAWDVVVRRRVSPERARWPVHVLAAGRLGRYGWDYRNPVEVVQGGRLRTVADDRIAFRALLGGLGVELARGGGLTAGVTLAAGVQDFAEKTREGFRNDLFERRVLFEVLAELVYAPPW